MEAEYFIGLDIGTTSTKAIVFSTAGDIKGMANHGYSLQVPKPGWSEQDPDAILNAVITALRSAIAQADVSPKAIAAIGISGAMHSLIAMDAQNQRLTNSITWADTRSIEQAKRLQQDGSGAPIYQRTGTPIHPMSPLTKLMWMQQHDSQVFRAAAKFISVKEYVLYHLLGQYVVDFSIASTTGLFNLKQLTWDHEALAFAGIRPDQLSQLVPTTYILRGIKPEWADAIGLHPDTPIVVGASDGPLANLGVGALAADQIAITIGTSAAVRGVVPQPITDAQGRTFCYALTENHWVVGGPSNNGGILLRWFRDQFSQAEIEQASQQGVDPYDRMIQAAADTPAGADGLLFLPFLSGERAPNWNPDARGVFFGVALHHTRSHFARSVLEGILFNIYEITQIVTGQMGKAPSILASGGFARSYIWRQLMADLFGYEVLVPYVYEASGFGAAALAMYAIGALEDLSQVPSLIGIEHRHVPDFALTQRYHQLFQVYQRLYTQLVDEFSVIAAYQRQFS